MSDSDTTSFEDPSTREIVLAVVPKITGALSLCSSGWIAYNVLSDRHRRTKTYHQLLALMSLCDMVGSFAYFLSTGPIFVLKWSIRNRFSELQTHPLPQTR